MQRIGILVCVLAAFTREETSTQLPDWRSSWIAGGSDAAPGEFPYQAYLLIVTKNITTTEAFQCGGSIISKWYILTAAHCVLGYIAVVVGTNKLDGSGDIHVVSHIILHSAYSKSRATNDIALLKLMRPIVFSSSVQPITLPKQGDRTGPGTPCITTGWGHSLESDTPNNLKKLQLNIISNSECHKYYEDTILNTQICAIAGYRQGICEGDSGSPLVCGGKQVGIASLGPEDCGQGRAGVFTRVSEYISWIKRNAV